MRKLTILREPRTITGRYSGFCSTYCMEAVSAEQVLQEIGDACEARMTPEQLRTAHAKAAEIMASFSKRKR